MNKSFFYSFVILNLISSFAIGEEKLKPKPWPECNQVLEKAPKAFGNFNLVDSSSEYHGMYDSYGTATGRTLSEVGTAALVLYQKGWHQFDVQGASQDEWYSSYLLGKVQLDKSVMGTVLEASDIYDIRLSPKLYAHWDYILMVASYELAPASEKSWPIVSKVLEEFSLSQREAILFAYLSGGVVNNPHLKYSELFTKFIILKSGGFSRIQATQLAEALWEQKYKIDEAIDGRSPRKIGTWNDGMTWISSRRGSIAPPPLLSIEDQIRAGRNK